MAGPLRLGLIGAGRIGSPPSPVPGSAARTAPAVALAAIRSVESGGSPADMSPADAAATRTAAVPAGALR